MSLEYAENRIREALKACGGSQVKARQEVTAWAVEDSALLYALAKPHLSGIVAYNVERVASGRADKAQESEAEQAVEAEPVQKKVKPPGRSEDENFGLEILKAIAGSSQIFGLEDTGAPQKRGATSQSHIEAIRAIADKNKSE